MTTEVHLDLDDVNEYDIAIIGMAGRFPGANNVIEFWENLRNEVESITALTDEELLDAGVDSELLNNPNYVKAAPILDDPGRFDAGFFGYSPREATAMDPQHRLFLETAWQSLEDAGYDPENVSGPIGVYGGAAMNTYLLFSGLLPHFATDYLPTLIGNDNSFLTTRVSYKLNLRGPSVTVQTACSSSLVAVHHACQSLLSAECDMALAGGVSVRVPHRAGHLFQEGSVFSPDGHCRTFDVNARGTIFGSGVGIVVLKRLSDAVTDGDRVYAVIKGSAINNDGSSKVDYTAPSVNSQADVIAEAIANAGIEARDISYVEAHGTGTYLGDPIELAALTKAFRQDTNDAGFCAVGSVKTNIGHLDAAAGIAGLIKTALALKHRVIPATLHFSEPNPQIDFANSPFFVNNRTREWVDDGGSRIAGISSLGIGGTNAHVILQEAPYHEGCDGQTDESVHLVTLSARTASSLGRTVRNLVDHLEKYPTTDVGDLAYTLYSGRRQFDFRCAVAAANVNDAVAALRKKIPLVAKSFPVLPDPAIVFMFPGQGSQYPNMSLDLYMKEPVFRRSVDGAAQLLEPHLGIDLRSILYPDLFVDALDSENGTQESDLNAHLTNTIYAQPAIFVVEYSLTQLLLSHGVKPSYVVGHSIGEYVAACVAGVVSLEDALKLVTLRGRLMQDLPRGSMMAVGLSEQDLRQRLNGKAAIAAINGPDRCVVSGAIDSITSLEKILSADGVACRHLHTSHAFHSPMMNPILDTFRNAVAQVQLRPPEIPIASSVTGEWITANEMASPEYWARNLRETVRFADACARILCKPDTILLEVGPGKSLGTFARQHPDCASTTPILSTMRHPLEDRNDNMFYLEMLGQLWSGGHTAAWFTDQFKEHVQRVMLPPYAFEETEYWYEASAVRADAVAPVSGDRYAAATDHGIYIPSWKRMSRLAHHVVYPALDENNAWVIFHDENDLYQRLCWALEKGGHTVVHVAQGEDFVADPAHLKFVIDPGNPAHYDHLWSELKSVNVQPQQIIHLWNAGFTSQDQDLMVEYELALARSFHSLVSLAQSAAAAAADRTIKILIVSSQVQDVTGVEQINPLRSTLLGPCQVIPKEYENLSCCSVDIDSEHTWNKNIDVVVAALLDEFQHDQFNRVVAYRGLFRWEPDVESSVSPLSNEVIPGGPQLTPGGAYIIVGGFGGIGRKLALLLSRKYKATIIIIGRTELPARDKWTQWLAEHDRSDPLSQRITHVQLLEEEQTTVLSYAADVCDLESMRSIFKRIAEQCGVIQGIIHAAGLVEDGLMELKSRAEWESVLRPKVKGSLVLRQLAEEFDVRFLSLFSSASALQAPIGQVDYSAANTFMDHLASSEQERHKTFVNSINWPGWKDTGMFARMAESSLKEEAMSQAIDIEAGLAIFEEIMHRSIRRAIVSNLKLGAADVPIDPNQVMLKQDVNGASSDYPETHDLNFADVTESVRCIWQEKLGTDQIDLDDNFFDLGGSSLIATQVLATVRELTGIQLNLRTIFDAPTLRELSAVIQDARDAESASGQKQDDLDTMAILSRL